MTQYSEDTHHWHSVSQSSEMSVVSMMLTMIELAVSVVIDDAPFQCLDSNSFLCLV